MNKSTPKSIRTSSSSDIRLQNGKIPLKLKDQVAYKGPQSTLQNKVISQLMDSFMLLQFVSIFNYYSFDELDKEDLSDGEDEQPTIVVLKEGDLSAEEAKVIQTDLELKAEDEPPSDERMMRTNNNALDFWSQIHLN
ncbi:unnamed protein product [Lepeophtheirus salmonis]|uniref:(salmon louse) hypothetical protein n=1 Tax=Lepeophtheirus salmonis TaxID=72036 RepID=A0A7R8H693_LEPSM|nr:unnamed protein product [Lepeophtheirus salmonis]CAF2883984.1 unnamed protein product [Lepeophtheirus salmonis]